MMIISLLKVNEKIVINENFDDEAQKEFLKGAKIAYETIITDFSDNDNKITDSKPLLNNEVYNQFNEALKDRSSRGHFAEITFIGINSAVIKDHKKMGKILNVTVEFIAEIITCIRDKDKKIISGDPEKIKKIYDTWVFSKDITKITKIIDLHGYSLDEANKTINEFINKSFEENVTKIIVITGKGLHSENEKNPYVSKNLSILKYSVPEYIETNQSLMSKIINISDAKIEDGGSGAFYIYLKKKR